MRRKSNRFRTRDYSLAGYYFVTICSKNKVCLFGNIEDSKMVLNDLGQMVFECIGEIDKHFGDVEVARFVVMPNHVHLILRLKWRGWNGVGRLGSVWRGRIYATRTEGNRSKMLLSKIIQNLKAAVTRNSGIKNIWQRSFHDRVIRDQKALETIEKYIKMNPMIWFRDRNYR